jgi:uncharacterized membrane protein (Fun14 family)
MLESIFLFWSKESSNSLITGYAIKKVIKLAAVIVGLFIAGLAYLEYQRILDVDWHKVQAISQSGIDRVADALTHVSSTIGTAIQERYLILGFRCFLVFQPASQ